MVKGKWEPLAKNCRVLVTPEHRFNTDTLLLAAFSAPKSGFVCADFGTGCGTIALLWAARNAPGEILGVELQEQAFLQALASVRENGFETIRLLRQDVRSFRDFLEAGSLDLIACNPPYKAQGTGPKNEVHNLRIARHEEALTLGELGDAAAYTLKFGGRLCICQRPERLTDAVETLRKKGLEPKRLRLVQQRQDKAPFLFLLECRRGGRPGLHILPTLFIEDGAGNYSAEMLEIYGDYKEGNCG